MSLQEQVKNAENPKVALEAIARYLDHLNTKIDQVLDQPNDDSWGEGWNDHERHVEVNNDFAKETEIKELEEALSKESNPEERAVLEARLRLAKDDGQAVAAAVGVEEGERTKMQVGDTETIVEVFTPNESQLEMREAMADKLREADVLDEEIIESFIKGGPLLLYYTDREFIMSLPYGWRRAFVEDVEVNSPQEAAEMARDILKVEDPEANMDQAIDNQRQILGSL